MIYGCGCKIKNMRPNLQIKYIGEFKKLTMSISIFQGIKVEI